MPSKITTVFLDAGYTLVFPRLEKLGAELTRLGFPTTAEDFEAAERAAKKKEDELLWPLLRNGQIPKSSSMLYWQPYFDALADRLGASPKARPMLLRKVAECVQDIHTWSRVLPETIPALQALRAAGYRLAAISNSDGRIEAEIARAGLRQHLEFVIDSALVGIEKPHPEIFQIALQRAQVSAEEALYVGDIHSADIGGAQRAGLRGILYDHVGAYPEAECPRITTFSALEQAVSEFNK